MKVSFNTFLELLIVVEKIQKILQLKTIKVEEKEIKCIKILRRNFKPIRNLICELFIFPMHIQ